MSKDILRTISEAVISASKSIPDLSEIQLPKKRIGLAATAVGLYILSGPLTRQLEEVIHRALPEELKDRLGRGNLDQLQWPLISTENEKRADDLVRLLTPMIGADPSTIELEELVAEFGGRYCSWEERRFNFFPLVWVLKTGEYSRIIAPNKRGEREGVVEDRTIFKVSLIGRQRLFTPLPPGRH